MHNRFFNEKDCKCALCKRIVRARAKEALHFITTGDLILLEICPTCSDKIEDQDEYLKAVNRLSRR